MILATIRTDARGQMTGCTLQGHSDHAEEGSDIVCAAVSVLGATCVNSLETVCGIKPVITGNVSGLLSFRLPDGIGEGQMHDAQVLLKALKQGLTDVAEQFPRDIRLAVKNGGNRHDQA